MLHVNARSFRNVILVTALATMVAAPGIPAAATTADTPVGTAAAERAGDEHRSYNLHARKALATGAIVVTQTHVSVTGVLSNSEGRAALEISVSYSEGMRHRSPSRTFRTRFGQSRIPTEYSISGHNLVVHNVEVEVCHRTDWFDRRPRCDRQVFDFASPHLRPAGQ
jgi:hypothetical protein